jgi:hypothetical protein
MTEWNCDKNSNTPTHFLGYYHLYKMGNGHLRTSIDIEQRLMKVFAVSADNLLNGS